MVSFVNESLEPKTKLSAKQLVFFLLLFDHSVVSDSSVTPWTAAHQAPLSMGFPRHEYWSGLPFPSPGDLTGPGIKPRSPALAGRFFTVGTQVRWGHTWFCSSHCPGREGLPPTLSRKEMKEEARLTALYPPTHCWEGGA